MLGSKVVGFCSDFNSFSRRNVKILFLLKENLNFFLSYLSYFPWWEKGL